MSKLFDIINKAGFAARSSGDDIFPAVLLKDDVPIGFLNEDLSVSLISDKENLRDQLEQPISFAIEYQDFDVQNGEYVMAEYKDTVFTAFYDFDAKKVAFNVCHKDSDAFTVISSGDEREKVATEFTKMSGLLSGDSGKDRAVEKSFIEAIKTIGFSVSEKVSEANRKYEISDGDGNLVGYINRSNNLTFVTDDRRVRNALSRAFMNESNSKNSLVLPSFLSKLKDGLKNAGMALKASFGTGEPQYTIVSDGKVVATMENENQAPTFAQGVDQEQKQKVEKLIREDDIKETEIKTPSAQEQQMQQTTPAVEQAVQPQELTPSDLMILLAAITNIPGIREYIPDQLQGKIQSVLGLIDEEQERKEEVQETTVPQTEEQSGKETTTIELTDEQQSLLMRFDDATLVLETAQAINPPNVAEIQSQIVKQFGTANRNEFLHKLVTSTVNAKEPLISKLDKAQDKADAANQRDVAETQQTKENAKEI